MFHRPGWRKSLRNHLRKSGVFLLNLILNHRPVFCAIGWLNSRFDFLSSVFVVYPASRTYALSYVYRRHCHLLQWQPWLIGLFKQDDKWGIMLAITNTEEDFYQSGNEINLQRMVDSVELVRHCVGASQKTFSGVLPSILHAKGIIIQALEADVTVRVVVEAERKVRAIEQVEGSVPLIILGGQGFIGRRLISELNGRETYSIDIADQTDRAESWPQHIYGRQAILLNVSKRAVLAEYLSRLWPEIVILNEVYPEPDECCLQKIAEFGLSAYHVVGVAGKAYPPFPKAYRGGIPACSARLAPDMQVLVKKLV